VCRSRLSAQPRASAAAQGGARPARSWREGPVRSGDEHKSAAGLACGLAGFFFEKTTDRDLVLPGTSASAILLFSKK
jgi:hypothetical protein